MTTDELIEYYEELLIVQYSTKVNARAMTGAFVAEAVASQIIASVRDAFNLPTTVGPNVDTAVGDQLDMLATYRGLTREVFGVDITRVNWLMPRYGDAGSGTDPGFGLYGSPVTWFWPNYNDVNRPIYDMNDSELTRMIQFRAQTQSNLLSVYAVDLILFDFFGENAAVFESGTMEIIYVALSNDPDSLVAIANDTNSLPRPAGVGSQLIFADSISGFFGFQIYSQSPNNTFVGFGLYGAPQAAAFLRYS